MRLHEYVWASANRYPEEIALLFPHASDISKVGLTYSELKSKVDEVSISLRGLVDPRDDRGLTDDQAIIMFSLPRGELEAYVTLLAILQQGAAYCAIDQSFPNERAIQMIEDARPVCLIVEPHEVGRWEMLIQASIAHETTRVISFDELVLLTAQEEQNSQPDHRPSPQDPLRELAYLIYTSGSTGQPKGVMIEHGNIMHLIEDDLRVFDLAPGDRVLQGSSLSYDSSVEEMFMAWSAGATVVAADDSIMRLGPDLCDWLIQNEITVLAPPPTLLRTMGRGASERLKQLRILYVGGEALPIDIAQEWAVGRVFVNGYGPTECSVTATRAWISEDTVQITIGKPHPGLKASVVNSLLSPVVSGEEGELLLSGPALARGYLNSPELTASRFIDHPLLGRSYRTGDRVSINPQGDLVFLGRADDQVKLRGYRLELTEVERHLTMHGEIREAACVLAGEGALQRLVAFIIVEEKNKDFSLTEVLAWLAQRLPHYMIPSQLILIERLPRLNSDKIDRKSLMKHVEVAPQHGNRAENEAKRIQHLLHCLDRCSGDERLIYLATLMELIASQGENKLSADDDFFSRGGDSVSAATLISLLRQTQSFNCLAVRDIYQQRSCRELINLVDKRVVTEQERGTNHQERCSARVKQQRTSQKQIFLTTMIQGALIALVLMLGALIISGLFLIGLPWLLSLKSLEVWFCILWIAYPLQWVIWLPISVWMVRVAKRGLIGRYSECSSPVWGWLYFKHWLLSSMSRTIPWGQIEGSPLYSWVLRQLGAEIGRDVYFHRGVNLSSGGWDLIKIGDRVTCGRDVSIRPIEFDRLMMHWRSITIEDEASLEIRSGVSGGSRVGAKALLSPHSAAHSHDEVPPNFQWSGASGEDLSERVPPKMETIDQSLSTYTYLMRFHLAQIMTTWLLGLPSLLVGIWILRTYLGEMNSRDALLVNPVLHLGGIWNSLIYIVLLSIIGLGSWLIYVGLLCRWRGKIPLGTQSVWSQSMITFWQRERLMMIASRWLSGTVMWPAWLRLSGMRVGPDSEISTIMEVVPEHIIVEGECFSADGIYFGAPRIRDRQIHFAETRFERGVFLGNHSVIHAGSVLKSNSLLGVCTSLDAQISSGSWFGNPAFELPNREVVTVDQSLTHKPSTLRYLNRLFWEIGRAGILMIGLLEALWLSSIAPFSLKYSSGVEGVHTLMMSDLFYFSGALIGILGLNVLFVLMMKWILLGRMREGQHPLWSCWCSRWDAVYVYWGALARGALSFLEGTLWLNMVLRGFGLKIGKRVFLGSGFAQVVDPDMLRFEDEVTVMNLFQAHSFEDRVLKLAPVNLRRGSSVGSFTVVLYGAEIGENVLIKEHSVVMKREHLTGGLVYKGAPTRECKR